MSNMLYKEIDYEELKRVLESQTVAVLTKIGYLNRFLKSDLDNEHHRKGIQNEFININEEFTKQTTIAMNTFSNLVLNPSQD